MDLLKITLSYVYGVELFTGCINSMTVNLIIHWMISQNKDGADHEEDDHHGREEDHHEDESPQ